MAIIPKKRLEIQERNKNRSTLITYPKSIISKEEYYKDEIKRLESINKELSIIIHNMNPLKLFRELLSFKCLHTLKLITIIQCSERQKNESCNCANRGKVLRDYLNIR